MAASSIFTGSGTTSTMSLTVLVTGVTGESLSFFAGRAGRERRRSPPAAVNAAARAAAGPRRVSARGLGVDRPCLAADTRRAARRAAVRSRRAVGPGDAGVGAAAAGAAAAVGVGFATGETDGRVTFGTAGSSTGRDLPFPLPLPWAGAEAAESLPRPVRTGAACLALRT